MVVVVERADVDGCLVEVCGSGGGGGGGGECWGARDNGGGPVVVVVVAVMVLITVMSVPVRCTKMYM